MTFTQQPLQARVCPACGARASFVIESRTSSQGRRRRYGCNECGHRDTTYEIDQSVFHHLQTSTDALASIQQALAAAAAAMPPPPPAHAALPCHACPHALNDRCTLTIPEAFTPDAADCIHADPS